MCSSLVVNYACYSSMIFFFKEAYSFSINISHEMHYLVQSGTGLSGDNEQ